jgi:hypothetical protein
MTVPALPPAQPPKEKKPERNPNDLRMFGHLREIRASAQYLQSLAADELAKALAMDAAARSAYLSAALPAALLQRVDAVISPCLEKIGHLFALDVCEHNWCSDTVVEIQLTWAQVKDLWPAPSMLFEVMERRLKQVDACLDDITYHCGQLSLSPRINETLENLRIGQPLDFEFKFGDELPKSPELRKRLFLELAQEAGVIESGVVDAERGVIYKVASSRNRQRLSVVWLAAAVVIGGVVLPLVLARAGTVISPWPLQETDWKRLLADYAMILIGSAAHLAIAALKSARSQTRPSFQAVNDWILWLHARHTAIWWSIGYVWLGYVLLLSFGLPKLDWQSAFFAGYSIDSVMDVFLDRFQTMVKAKTEALTSLAKKAQTA